MTIDALKRRISGAVVTAIEPGFGAEHDALIWNGRKPAPRARLIVRAASAADVQEAVGFAAAHGLTVSPRGGGHHLTGIAARADMVIDLGALKGLQIDTAARSARVEPAVTNVEMATALDQKGLAFPLGHCGSVPMSGYLLGGGVGWNGGAWGFACGLVTSAEVVLVDGRRVTASATENPEVFWALRGAGPGFFGIVTAYRLDLMPAPAVIETVIRVYPGAMAAEIASWAETMMAKVPASVEFTAKVATGPAGPMVAAIATAFADSADAARAVHEGLAVGAPSALDVIGPMQAPMAGLYQATDPSVPVGRRYRVDSVWSDADLGAILARTVDAMAHAPSAETFAVLTLRPNAVPMPSDAALSRSGRIFGAVYGLWPDAADDERNAVWLHGLIGDLSPLCSGTYVGLCDLDRPGGHLPTHSDAAARRLADLRRRFDPRTLFTPARAASALAAE
ncbi:FAD-binding oxidoreductase [Polymorphum gilvum]|uniref:FAD linked oxidase-like protein n=1 Tax=Polymorphum gilvum (strain LMG 25793 / CGMCC 1.9160 / SL003B-26A1) TaxID=991905 RepID=F2J3I2_POLGS|nr:FAD-binding oxidoreductase [Polymorphum gilvum]ADZ71007.1 FAD linked oxidase-like protein [Polymorphum gilvum SL003B-26A1]